MSPTCWSPRSRAIWAEIRVRPLEWPAGRFWKISVRSGRPGGAGRTAGAPKANPASDTITRTWTRLSTMRSPGHRDSEPAQVERQDANPFLQTQQLDHLLARRDRQALPWRDADPR